MDNLEYMDKFLEICNLPRLNQEEVKNMDRSIANSETESVIKQLQQTKFQNQMASQVNSSNPLKKS